MTWLRDWLVGRWERRFGAPTDGADATDALRDVRRLGVEVQRETDHTRRIVRENHLGPLLDYSMRPAPPRNGGPAHV